MAHDDRQVLTGWLAALATVFIWSSYFISLRFAGPHNISAVDLAMLRYGVPALLLTPLFYRLLPKLQKKKWLHYLVVVSGAGLPFFMLSHHGVNESSAALGSTLITGLSPMLVNGVSLVLGIALFTRTFVWGALFISAGSLVLIGSYMDAGLPSGSLALLGSAFCWAAYTLAMRYSGLRAMETAALLTVPNFYLLVGWQLFQDQPLATLITLDKSVLIAQVVVQGLVVGVVSSVMYATAVARLGAGMASSAGSLTPGVASLIALLLLGEQMSFQAAAAIALTSAGVLILSVPVRAYSAGWPARLFQSEVTVSNNAIAGMR